MLDLEPIFQKYKIRSSFAISKGTIEGALMLWFPGILQGLAVVAITEIIRRLYNKKYMKDIRVDNRIKQILLEHELESRGIRYSMITEVKDIRNGTKYIIKDDSGEYKEIIVYDDGTTEFLNWLLIKSFFWKFLTHSQGKKMYG